MRWLGQMQRAFELMCRRSLEREAFGGRLAESRVTRSDAATIYAAAVVSGPHGTSTLYARPSDAINLALRLRAPIRVDPAAVERQ
jgi:bifunctional DNase/RNase